MKEVSEVVAKRSMNNRLAADMRMLLEGRSKREILAFRQHINGDPETAKLKIARAILEEVIEGR